MDRLSSDPRLSKLRVALKNQGFLVYEKVYTDKRAGGRRRYKIRVAKKAPQGDRYSISEISSMDKEKINQIVLSVIPNATRYTTAHERYPGDLLYFVTYVWTREENENGTDEPNFSRSDEISAQNLIKAADAGTTQNFKKVNPNESKDKEDDFARRVKRQMKRGETTRKKQDDMLTRSGVKGHHPQDYHSLANEQLNVNEEDE